MLTIYVEFILGASVVFFGIQYKAYSKNQEASFPSVRQQVVTHENRQVTRHDHWCYEYADCCSCRIVRNPPGYQ